MTMVISPLEDMLQDSSLPADIQSNLRQMHKSSTRILSLINQLLDMRKFDEGQMQLHYAETDLINFLMGPFELYTQTAEKRGIEFTFSHSMAEQPVWIDRDSIDKVMMNLLSNAFKYTPDEGKIEMSVEVGTDDSEKGPLRNYVEISVSDTGIGLDKDDVNRIFDRFYRADNEMTSVTMGMGIGLNYSQMLIGLHHGTIKAENRSDGQTGSVFSFRLPLGNSHINPDDIIDSEQQIARPQLERNRASMDYDEPEDENRVKGSVKVLLVDDDDSMLDYLSDSLKHNYKIVTARNGKEGLKLAVSQMPDLIITDVVMPEMDGIQLVKALKGNSLVSHIPVIMLSGKNKLQDRMLGLDTGADSYLPKPFYMSELKSLMANLINNRLIVKGKFSGQQEQTEKVTAVQFESSDEQFMKRVMDIVNNNISNSEFNISLMVDEVGMSRTQLHRKLKELTGFSAAKFVQNIRMQQAMKLLKEKRVNVSQIAYSVGFSSQTHFSTTFKQFYGVSPTEYIRQLEADESKQ
jgi:DNA-binding response OmpR family regulator